jgi:type IV secretion system protein VirB2
MRSKHYKTDFNFRKALFISALCLTIFLPEHAHAQAALFDSGTNFLTALETLLTGTWARIAAIIAVVFLGFGWMSGRISWPVAGSIIGGIILVFGATAIVDGINGAI